MKPLLPQNDKNPDRKAWMEKNRDRYRYDHEYLPPIPVLEELPQEEAFTGGYLARRAAATADLIPNMAAAKIKSIFDPFDEVQDFEDLFTILPKPSTIRTWRTDEAFAEQRLSGANPMKMRQILHKDHLPFKICNLDQKIPGFRETLRQGLKEGRVFASDYSELDFIQGGTHEKGRKLLPKPKAVFFWQLMGYRDWGQLMPVAIQIHQDGPIMTPQGAPAMDWLIAKLCVQIAHANHHELSSHLTRTHLVMGPFGIATARHLAENHPLGLLLRPHFRFMLANTDLGQQSLMNKGGILDRLLAGTLEESLQVLSDSYKSWSVKEFAFPKDIENRGLSDEAALPHFPYRDDGLLIWGAVEKFVTSYIRLYYKKEKDVAQDTELQAWAKELKDPDQGHVIDMTSPINTRQELIDLVTTVIFTCGPQHGAVNFSQYDYMAFVPNMPLAAYCPVPGQNPNTGAFEEEVDEQFLMQFLPPTRPTSEQTQFAEILTSFKYDRLGFYEDDAFEDPDALQLVENFQQDLFQIERRIDLRNGKRQVPYPFMKPSEILNSISM